MEQLPKTSEISKRIVDMTNDNRVGLKIGSVLWVASIYWYKKTYFVHNQNMINWIMFSTGSYFASHFYGVFFFESPLDSASRINNEREVEHQKLLGNL